MKQKSLTKSEIQVMNILWGFPDGGYIHDIISCYEESKPAYTTIATFLKILYNKGFVKYEQRQGKSYWYRPVISKEEYTKMAMQEMKDNFFDGSGSSFVKFFVKQEKLSEHEIRELIDLVNHSNS